MPDAQLDLGRGEGYRAIDVHTRTPLFELKTIDDPPSPAHGLMAVDRSKKMGDLEPGDQVRQRGTFADGPDPKYQDNCFGVDDPRATIFPGMGAVERSAVTVGGAYLSDPSADRYDARTGDLFPTPPTLADIKQGSLADCGLLAAVGGIVARDPSTIVNMMKDDGPTVTVRLFDVSPPAPGSHADPVFTPRYVKVDKSSAVDVAGDDVHAKGSLWVILLEKAYAASGYVPDSYDVVRQRAFGNVDKAKPNIVLEHLLGQRARQHQVAFGAGGGKRFSGTYAPEQLATFRFVVDSLKAGSVVVAESKEEIARTRAATHGAGGEAVAKGLVGGHAYTVLDTRPKTVPAGGGVCEVLVRNPWGRYGRVYEPGAKPSAKGDSPEDADPTGTSTGMSWLELRDFTKRFERVFVS